MPRIPTQNEPGSAPLQTSAIDTEGIGTLSASANLRQASSLAGLLIGKASGAASSAQQTQLQAVLNKEAVKRAKKEEELRKEAAKLQQEKDLADASKALNKSLDLALFQDTLLKSASTQAMNTGEKVDKEDLFKTLQKGFEGVSAGLSPEHKVRLQGQLNDLTLSLNSGVEKINSEIDVQEIERADERSTKEALKNIYVLDRIPNMEDLEKAISSKEKSLEGMGISGKAKELHMEKVRADFTAEYYSTFSDMVMREMNPADSYMIDEDNRVRLPAIEQLMQSIIQDENLTTKDKGIALKPLTDYYKDNVKALRKNINESAEKVRTLTLLNNNDLKPADRKQASTEQFNILYSNITGKDLESQIIPTTGLTPQFQEEFVANISTALDTYYKQFPGTNFVPDNVANRMVSLAASGNPEVAKLGLSIYNSLKNNEEYKARLTSTLTSKEYDKFVEFATMQPLLPENTSFAEFNRSPEDFASIPRLIPQIRQDLEKQGIAASTGSFIEFSLFGEELNSTYNVDRERSVAFFEAVKGFPRDKAIELGTRATMQNYAKFTGPNTDIINQNENLVYMPEANGKSLDFDDMMSQLNPKIEKALSNWPESERKKAFNDGTPSNDPISRYGLQLIPIKNPGDVNSGVAHFKVATRKGNILTHLPGEKSGAYGDVVIQYMTDVEGRAKDTAISRQFDQMVFEPDIRDVLSFFPGARAVTSATRTTDALIGEEGE